jgi:hypothetical protein
VWKRGPDLPIAVHGIQPAFDESSNTVFVAGGGMLAGGGQSTNLQIMSIAIQPTPPPPTFDPATSPTTAFQEELDSVSFGPAEIVGDLPPDHAASESQGLAFENKLYYFGDCLPLASERAALVRAGWRLRSTMCVRACVRAYVWCGVCVCTGLTLSCIPDVHVVCRWLLERLATHEQGSVRIYSLYGTVDSS